MKTNYGSMNLESIDIKNDSSLNLAFLSDADGNRIGKLHFCGVARFLYQSIVEDNEDCEPIHIIEFIIRKLESEEVTKFKASFGFEIIPNEMLPVFYVILHGSYIDISFYCKTVMIEEGTGPFAEHGEYSSE